MVLCLFLAPAARSVAAETEKIGAVIECESMKKLMADITAMSKVLGMKAATSKIEELMDAMSSSPGRTGISSNKPFKAFLLMEAGKDDSAMAQPATAGKPVVLVFPLTGNGDSYLKSVGTAYSKKEKTGNITHFSLPVEEEDSDNEPNLYVGISGDQAVVGTSASRVDLILSCLGKSDPSTRVSLPGTIKVSMDVTAILPPLETVMKSTVEMMKEIPEGANKDMPMANPAQVLGAESDLLMAMMKQLKSCSFAIGVNDNSIELNCLLSPAEGSQLAPLVSSMVPPSGKYTTVIPANAFITISGTGMNIFDIFLDPYCTLIEKMFDSKDANSAKFKTALRDSIRSMKGAFSGEYCIAVVPGASKDLALVEIVGVNDGPKFRKTMIDMLTVMKDMYAAALPGMSLNFEANRMSGGIEVTPYSVAYAPPSASAQPVSPLMNIGKNYRSEIAVSGKNLIFTMGGGTAAMDNALARLKNGGTSANASAAFTRLFPNPPEKMVGTYSLELGKMIRFFVASMPNGEQMVQMIPDSNSGLAGYSVVRGNDLLTVYRLGFAEIECIKNSLMPLGMMMMSAAGGPAGTAGTPAGTNPETKCMLNLRMLGDAKEQCALEKGLKDGDTIEAAWLTPFLLRGKMPVCPEGGTYTINPVGKNPACSVPAHKLKN